MSIIGTLPNNIQDGQLVDASPLMADFNYIVNQVNANATPSGTLTAPPGTTTVFYQAAAPLGWTVSAGFTDHTIQVNATAGGTTGGAAGYSTMFQAAWTSGGTAISTSQMPAHAHGINDPAHNHASNDPGHAHGGALGTQFLMSGAGTAAFSGGGGAVGVENTTDFATTGISNSSSFTGIGILNTGGGAAHTHTTTFNVNYASMIMASKS